MKIFSSKKRVAAIGVVTAATLVGGGAAFAYWTTTGSGSGSATVGSSAAWTADESGDLIAADSPALAPDPSIGVAGHIQTHAYTVTNTGQGTQVLTNVAISIKNADGSAWSSDAVDPLLPVCDATDFSIGQEPVGVAKTDATLAGPFTAGQARSSAVTVQMINKPGANQDNCKGVSVPLYFSAS